MKQEEVWTLSTIKAARNTPHPPQIFYIQCRLGFNEKPMKGIRELKLSPHMTAILIKIWMIYGSHYSQQASNCCNTTQTNRVNVKPDHAYHWHNQLLMVNYTNVWSTTTSLWCCSLWTRASFGWKPINTPWKQLNPRTHINKAPCTRAGPACTANHQEQLFSVSSWKQQQRGAAGANAAVSST